MPVTLQQWEARLASAPGELKARVATELVRAGLLGVREAKHRATGNRGPSVRSGRLRASIKSVVDKPHLILWLQAGGRQVRYAAAQEYGADIRAKGKMLAIPLTAAKTAAGVSRGGPRTYGDLFPIRSKRGSLLLVRQDGGGIVPMFVLKDRVVIKARPYLRPGIEAAKKSLSKEALKLLSSLAAGKGGR